MSENRIVSTDYLTEILGRNESSEAYPLGSGVVVGRSVIATVRHVLESPQKKLLQNDRIIVRTRMKSGDTADLNVIRMEVGKGEADSTVLLYVDHEFSEECIAIVRPARGALGDDVVFCGYPERTSRAASYTGEGALAQGEAQVPGSTLPWVQINTDLDQAFKGMSGGPVFSKRTGHFVALISERAIVGDRKLAGPRFCLGLDAANLFLPPLDLEYVEDSQSSELGKERVKWNGLTPNDFLPLAEHVVEQLSGTNNFVGRSRAKKKLTDFWECQDPGSDSIFYIRGLPGIGKSAFLEWILNNVLDGQFTSKPEFVLYHDFDGDPTIEGLLQSIQSSVPGKFDNQNLSEIVDRLASLFRTSTGMVVFDGFEKMQSSQEASDFARIMDPELRRFVDIFENCDLTKLIIASRLGLNPDSSVFGRITGHRLEPFPDAEAAEFYEVVLGETASENWTEICSQLGNHPGALETVLFHAKSSGTEDLGWVLNLVKGQEPNDGYLGILEEIASNLSGDRQTVMLAISQIDRDITIEQLEDIVRDADFPLQNELFSGISSNHVREIVDHMKSYSLLDVSPNGLVRAHNVVKGFFSNHFDALPDEQQKRVQLRIAKSYSSQFRPGENPESMTLLQPGLDAVTHMCKAGEFVAAAKFLDEDVQGPGTQYTVSNRLAGVTDLWKTLLNFFPENDASCDPLLAPGREKNIILHYAGYCQSVQGGRPKEALEKLTRAARGAVVDNDLKMALNIFRAAAYSAVSAGDLKSANTLLSEAMELAAGLDDDKEKAKLVLQSAVAAHMTLGEEWKTKFDEAEAFIKTLPETSLTAYFSRNSIYLSLLGRVGYSRRANRLQQMFLRPYARERGWEDIEWRLLSIQAALANSTSSREAGYSTAIKNVSSNHRDDLRAEIAIRCARYLISNDKGANVLAKLPIWLSGVPLDKYPLLKLDFEVTIAAAKSLNSPETEIQNWERLEEEATSLSYRWALQDIWSYRKDPSIRLV